MTDPRPLFNQLNIVCGDMAASIEFYRCLGASLPDENVWGTATGAHHASVLDAGGQAGPELDLDSMAFAARWNAGWRGREDLKGRVVVGFGVASREEVDRLHDKMTGAGYRSLQQPYDAFWGARYAVIEDPDGIAVGLMSPRSADKRSEPPEV
ncbi:MAG: VOC family protein [Alphaproteobacteria bacterium]|nr:VOC family protein [Alphaproteobacteria bacterium]